MNFGQKETGGGTNMSNITYYNCGQQGYYTRKVDDMMMMMIMLSTLIKYKK